jgi:hypothetical protein
VLSRPANDRGHDWRWQSYDIPLGFTATTFTLRNGFDSDLCPPRKMVYALITETPRLGHAATSVSCRGQNRRTDLPHELCDGGEFGVRVCAFRSAPIVGEFALSIGSPLSETCGYLSARLHFTLCRLSDEHPY